MTTCNDKRTFAHARTVATLAAFALASCAADDLTEQTQTSAATTEPCSGQQPTQTIFLEDAQGHSFRLAHFSRCGWKYISDRDDSGPKLSFAPVAESRAAAPNADPLAVFVDGPTGYTFAYTQDTGWRFVGHIANDNP
ncbi:MAG TPA: hypothetical protein VLD59_17845 [Steroidobacteraceae bacterium]|nr:hypothetical protein [Steroidobacteraceae bacterium]